MMSILRKAFFDFEESQNAISPQ